MTSILLIGIVGEVKITRIIVKVVSVSIWSIVIFLLAIISSAMGVARAIKKQSIPHGIASALIPLYGLFYFYLSSG